MIFEKFPLNTFLPYPTFIILRLNVLPIWLFHTLLLFGTLEYTHSAEQHPDFLDMA